MAQTQTSGTAAGVALLRAVETEKPEGERICNDLYAKVMIPGGISFAISKWVIKSGLYDRMAPGAASFVVVRERYIDDFLITCLGEGFRQVVILGAGFDTRAYRIPGIEQTRVFEIDQAATQAVKIERLRRVIDPLVAHVTFLPVDFNTQDLGQRLKEVGYDETIKSIFIWQGVTYFLTAEGVDGTLDFIAHHSGNGSAVIFDYFYNEVLRDSRRSDVKMMRRAARMTGEEYMFGIDEGQAEAFLVGRGFTDVKDVPVGNIARAYFTGPNAGRAIPTGLGIVSARVI